MAWLETKGNFYRIRYRYGGSKQLLALHTSDKKEADESLARFDANLRLIERGIIDPPGNDADVGVYIVSAGKRSGRPAQEARVERVALATLFDSYLAGFPRGAQELRTCQTEATHIRHFRQLLDTQLTLTEVTRRILQAFVDARAKAAGKHKKCGSRDTVQKEIGTLTAIWNNWGVPQGLRKGPAPVKNLTLPMGPPSRRSKFASRSSVRLPSGSYPPRPRPYCGNACSLLCPKSTHSWTMSKTPGGRGTSTQWVVFAAHTGARRSEIRRSLTCDFDFDAKTVLIREKKKDVAKIETFRTVPMSPRLETTMRDWFGKHDGGPHVICMPVGA